MQHRTAFLAFSLAVLPVAALAHAHLLKADPAADAVLKASPPRIELHFTEDLEPAFSTITVTDAHGRAMNSDSAEAKGAAMHIALKKLTPGRYHVHWVSVAIDTHRTSGDYDFSVAP
jgi:methionine-rich copper-binding protein CopC